MLRVGHMVDTEVTSTNGSQNIINNCDGGLPVSGPDMKQQNINQIYCAAPTLSYCPWIPGAAEQELSKLILNAQYEYCICFAVMFLDVPVLAYNLEHVL